MATDALVMCCLATATMVICYHLLLLIFDSPGPHLTRAFVTSTAHLQLDVLSGSVSGGHSVNGVL